MLLECCRCLHRGVCSCPQLKQLIELGGPQQPGVGWQPPTPPVCVGKERGALWSTEPEEWTSLADSVERGVDGLDNPEEDSTIGSSPVEEPEEGDERWNLD